MLILFVFLILQRSYVSENTSNNEKKNPQNKYKEQIHLILSQFITPDTKKPWIQESAIELFCRPKHGNYSDDEGMT